MSSDIVLTLLKGNWSTEIKLFANFWYLSYCVCLFSAANLDSKFKLPKFQKQTSDRASCIHKGFPFSDWYA